MKKILSLVVASIAFLTLSACSSDEKGMDSQSQSNTSVQSLVAVGQEAPDFTLQRTSQNGIKNKDIRMCPFYLTRLVQSSKPIRFAVFQPKSSLIAKEKLVKFNLELSAMKMLKQPLKK